MKSMCALYSSWLQAGKSGWLDIKDDTLIYNLSPSPNDVMIDLILI